MKKIEIKSIPHYHDETRLDEASLFPEVKRLVLRDA